VRQVRLGGGFSTFARSDGLASATDSRSFVVWSDRLVAVVPVAGGAPVRLPELGTVMGAAVSREAVAVSLASGALRLWDRRKRRWVDRDLGDALGGTLAFAPDGALLASVASPNLNVWDVASRRQIAAQMGVAINTGAVAEVAFAGDPPRLVRRSDAATYVVDPIVWNTDLAVLEERVCGIVNRNLRRDEVLGFSAGRRLGRCVG
jgi:hypothetical protein